MGLFIDRNLSFRSHIHSLILRAYAFINRIFRSFRSRNESFLLKVFCIYVRPLLEYASPIWNPTKRSLVEKLERVQMYFIARAYDTPLKEENYSDFLRQIRIPSLEQRRLATDLLYLYKMVNGVFRGNCCPELKLSITRGSETKFDIPGNYGKRRKSSFVVRSCLLWNKLPTEVTSSRTVKEFRSRVFSLELARFVRN